MVQQWTYLAQSAAGSNVIQADVLLHNECEFKHVLHIVLLNVDYALYRCPLSQP